MQSYHNQRGGRGGPPGVVSIQSKALSLFLAWVSAINLTSINRSPPHVRRTRRTTRCSFHSKQGTQSVLRACGGRGGPPGVVSIQSKALSLFLAWVSAINLTSINRSPPRVLRACGGRGGPPGVVSIQSKALSLSSARAEDTRRTTRCSFHSKQGTQSVLRACGGRGGPPGVVSIQSKALSLFLAWVSAINLTSINRSPPRVLRACGGRGGPPGVVSIQSKALSLSSARAEDTRWTTRCSFHSKQGTQSVLRACGGQAFPPGTLPFKMVLSSQRAEIALLKSR